MINFTVKFIVKCIITSFLYLASLVASAQPEDRSESSCTYAREVTAETSGSCIKLSWETSEEKNNHFFEIQRLIDGYFTGIGKKFGQGTSSANKTYQFSDYLPEFGINYYRLRQVNYNGDEKFSNVTSSSYIPNRIQIYPNPTSDFIHFSVPPQNGKIQLYDTEGNLMSVHEAQQRIDIRDLPKGQYVLRVVLGNQSFHSRILKN